MKKLFKQDRSKPASTGLLVVLLGLSTTLAGFSQTPPPNDNLANSTVLTGTDVTFTGTLAGATLEGAAEATNLANYIDYRYVSNSVWWSWTAPVTTVLNIELHPFAEYSPTQYGSSLDGLAVYSATNGTTSPSGLPQPPLAYLALFAGLENQTFTIPVSAGTNYRLQLIGFGTNTYTFHLVATNNPLILKQPVSETVYSNGSTLFYVVAGGLQPRTYQWYFNGTNLPGETTPILAFNNIDASQAGAYSVLVSNASGSMMSDAATLAISQSNVPPVLNALGHHSNVLAFNLTGESGRAYRIESSSNLVDWTNEFSLPFTPQISHYGFPTSVVFNTNSPLSLLITNSLPRMFYRASIYKPDSPHSEICINNLRQILIAKQLWRAEAGAYLTASPTRSNIMPYFAHPETIVCPLDTGNSFNTSYTIGTLGQGPQCQIYPWNHFLELVP